LSASGERTAETAYSSGVSRDGDTPQRGLGNDAPPSGLGVGEGLQEEGADEQVLELGVLTVSRGDIRQEDRLPVSFGL
jgi:hypothetical protein